MDFQEWVYRWALPPQAVQELRELSLPDRAPAQSLSEAAVQSRIRLEAAQRGANLMRNNSGAFKDETGRLIRFGLGNDSARIVKVRKSSDLIGLYPVQIAPRHIGRTFGVFTATEVKQGAWSPHKTLTAEEQAQSNFLSWVVANGGIATFATHIDQLTAAIRSFEQ